ncbi:hypothetical protein DRP43_00710 [candidate division TA06 bacterium]|uniref:HEPN domain-containing protein n=1 Tax=candidate division TA06 bacterium TaxID=2250710 RepID=A0A660SRA8_UNCT6|nr:MAG: hypothetical protein DRP43_00710 [candidate division TA06 bacterium]
MNLNKCFEERLLRNYKFTKSIVNKEIVNANRHLSNARRCVKYQMYDLAVVSVYTAMFHTSRAILFRDGIKERSHICVIIYINEKYPHLSEYVNILDNYRKIRHTMLYGLEANIIKDDATYGIDIAEEYIKAIEEEIGKNQI